jgi:hypothetical protein
MLMARTKQKKAAKDPRATVAKWPRIALPRPDAIEAAESLSEREKDLEDEGDLEDNNDDDDDDLLGPDFNATLLRPVENPKSLIFLDLVTPSPDQVAEESTLLNALERAIMIKGLAHVPAEDEELQECYTQQSLSVTR